MILLLLVLVLPFLQLLWLLLQLPSAHFPEIILTLY
jgi:hypothetical protein